MKKAILLALSLATLGCGSRDDPRTANLLLVSIDTCRADHLSAYGYGRPTTPVLEDLAAGGVLFRQAFSHVPETTPGHASLFTSRHPLTHGAANGVPLRPGLPTLAERLRDAGLRTAAFVSGWTMTAKASGLDRGFELYDDDLTSLAGPFAKTPNERVAAETTTAALGWLAEHRSGPFFLFVHYFDPHARYQPPAPYDVMFRSEEDEEPLAPEEIPDHVRVDGIRDPGAYRALYDGEIRYVDAQLGRLLEFLGREGLRESTLVAVTADHGENLGDHGIYFRHGWSLFDSALRVPLVLSWPGVLPPGQVVDPLVRLIDVAPTLLELLGAEPLADVEGRSLRPLIRGTAKRPLELLAETTKGLTVGRLGSGRTYDDRWAIRTRKWKLVRTRSGDTRRLVDLEADPGENVDLAAARPDVADRLEQELSAARRALGGPSGRPVRD